MIKYSYDSAGRRSTVWASWARLGLPSATTSNATYNADNQLTSWNGTSLGYDANGNLTLFGSQTYTWNARNQLTATSGGSASFAYDGLGRRISKTVGGTTTKYLYDGLNPVQEQNSSGTPTANEITDGGDQTFWRNDLGNGTVRSLLTDGLGSTVAGVDASGTGVQASYTYTPYGQQTTTLGATETNPFQYTGREWDGATGLQYNRARYYNPALGRFISEDPLDVAGSAPDLYLYARDAPPVFTDITGLSPLAHLLAWLADHRIVIGLVLGILAVLTGGIGFFAEILYAASVWTFAAEVVSLISGITAATLDQAGCRAGDQVACVGAGLGVIGAGLSAPGIVGGIFGFEVDSTPWMLTKISSEASLGVGSLALTVDFGDYVYRSNKRR